MIASTSRKIKGGSALHRAHPPYLIPAQQSPVRLAQSLERTAVLFERDAELTLDRLLRRVEDRLHRLEELAALGSDLEEVRAAVRLVWYAFDEPPALQALHPSAERRLRDPGLGLEVLRRDRPVDLDQLQRSNMRKRIAGANELSLEHLACKGVGDGELEEDRPR